MKKIASFSLITSVLSLSSSLCLALPSHPEVFSGTAEVSHTDPHTMEIKPSDQAILHYKDFQIGSQEKVRFIQNSCESCVLNRITGENPSQILGSIQSNGKVFLVNPNGIYFGPDSTVNVGSLIASTLDIASEDFIQEKYRFALSQEKNASIINEGLVHSAEGSIVLMAPRIHNLGVIEAKAGSVVLASGEHVTLDFTGDGLVQFAVEGSLKDAVIEHLGEIHGSLVSMKLPVAKKAITEIVNMDGVREADVFIEENGVIKFASASQIQSKRVQVEGSQVVVQGSIDASDALEQGGNVHLFGKEIVLEGALINTSGLTGGGEVLIGGEFQGKGKTAYASQIVMDEFSEIYAEAIETGHGGLVVLWSQDHTSFHGTIYAQGGVLEGNGGLVETSSRGYLNIEKGIVNTLDSKGQAGEWLLDPSCMNIVSGNSFLYGFGNTDTSNFLGTIGTDNFLNLTSNVTILASSSINIYDSFNVTGSPSGFHPTLTFQTSASGSVSVGDPSDCSKNITMTTTGGSINLVNISSFFLQCPVTTITTNDGDLQLNSLAASSTCYDSGSPPTLTINAGLGSVAFNVPYVPGNPDLLGSITINSAGLVTTNNVYINGAFTMPSIPMQISGGGTPTINTNGHDISIGSIDIASGFTGSLNLIAGASNTITIGDVGSVGPVTSFSIGSDAASLVTLSSVTTTGGDISIAPASIFGSSSTLTANGGSVSLSSTSTSGTLIADGDMNFAQASTISGDFTAGKSINAAGSLLLGGTSVLTAPAGIFIASNISGGSSDDLTLSASNSSISIGGNVSGLHGFIINSASDATFFNISTSGGPISIACQAVIQGSTASIVSSGGNITLYDDLLPNISGQSLSINAGSGDVSVNGMGDSTFPFENITLIGDTISATQGALLNGDFVVDNAGTFTLAGGTVRVGGNFDQTGIGSVFLGSSIFTTGSIAFSDGVTVTTNVVLRGIEGITIPGAITTTSVTPSLTLNGGNHPLTILSLGSNLYPFGSVSMISSNLTLEGDIITASVASSSSPSVTISSPIVISVGTSIIGPDGIALEGALTTTSSTPSLTLNAGSSPLVVSGLGNDAYPLGTLSLTGSSLTIEGNIVTNGAITFSGPVALASNVTLEGTSGITFSSTLVSSMTAYDLTLISSGSINVLDLGSGALPLGSIAITSDGLNVTRNLISSGNIDLAGTSMTLGPNITADGNIEIDNTGLLSIPLGTINVTGNFVQTGLGAVSLGSSITAAGSIAFDGPVTTTANISLEGSLGISVPGSIIPSSAHLNLNLNAGDNPLSTQSLGSLSFPLGRLTIEASELYLDGNIYTSSSLSLTPPITITANTSVVGPRGIVLSGPVTASSGTPSLSLTATSGVINIQSLGSDSAPLGAVSLTGVSVFLGGNIFSNATLGIAGSVVIDTDLTLRGDTGVSFASSLLPDRHPFDLTLQAVAGSVSVKSLGSKLQPLGDVSVTGVSATIGGNITASSIDIAAPVTLSSSSTWTARGGISTSSSIDGLFPLTLDGVSSTQGVIVIGGSIGETTPLSSFTIQNALTSSLSSIFTNAGLIQISSALLLNNHSIMNSSGGTVALKSVVDSEDNTHYNLSIAAGVGTILMGNNIGGTTPLGSFTVNSAQSVELGGSVLYTLGSTSIYSPLTSSISTLNITSESYGNLFITSYMGTENGIQNLILAATQNVQIGSIGSSSLLLGEISITGDLVTLAGSVYAQGGLSIVNSGELSIEVGNVVLGGSFSQSGAGNVSLGENITANSISFNSPITLTGDSTLISNQGLSLNRSVDGAFGFTLIGTAGDVFFQNTCLGCGTALASLTVQGTGLRFSGTVGLQSVGNVSLALPCESSSLAGANVTISAGSSTVDLGPIGLNMPLGSIDVTAGLLQTQGIGTSGGPIVIHAPVELLGSQVVVDTTRSGSSGAMISFDDSINSSVSELSSLSLVSGMGEIVLAADIGNTNLLQSFSVESTHSFVSPNVAVAQDMTINAPLILSNVPVTTFSSQNNGSISLGSVDGTTSGSQSLTFDTTGIISLGVVGENVPLQELVITQASHVNLQSVFTQGDITVTPPIVFLSSATLNSSGNFITLGPIDGTTLGGQNLTVDAGDFEVFFTGNIGAITPLANVNVTASWIEFGGSTINALGSQSYYGSVEFVLPVTFQAQGNVLFNSSLDAITAGSDLSFYMGTGGLTFAGFAGDAPFGAISVFNASSFTAQDILAGSLRVSGGSTDVILYGDVSLSDPSGIFLDGNRIEIYGQVNALYRFFRARELVSSLNFPVSFNISNPTPIESQYINLVLENIGSQSHPIEVSEDFVAGSYFRADYIGNSTLDDGIISFVDSSHVLTFDGMTIGNSLSRLFVPELFQHLPKDLFYLPGIYSSWDNLSNDEYFLQEPANLGINPRDRTLFYTYLTGESVL